MVRFLEEQKSAFEVRDGARACASRLYDLAVLGSDAPVQLPFVADIMGIGEQSTPESPHCIDNQSSLYKMERYAPAAAIFARMADRALEGYGRDARFKEIVRSERRLITPIQDKRIVQTASDIKATILACGRSLEANKQTRMPEILGRFELMSIDEVLRTGRSVPSLESVLMGGDMPNEFAEYINLSCHLMRRVPELKEGTAEIRRDAAHDMLPLLTRRSSLHVEMFRVIRPIIDVGIYEAHIERKATGAYTIDYPARVFENGRERPQLTTPLLECPANFLLAHQKQLPVVESALLRSLNACVNLAYDRHVFGEPNRQQYL